jgi:hypothetical protein
MRLKEALEQKQFDTRLLDKKLAEGKLSQKEYQDFLEAIPDDSENLTIAGKKSEKPTS